ncbi:hypothetical protein D3C87_1920600 [compost metagenome]
MIRRRAARLGKQRIAGWCHRLSLDGRHRDGDHRRLDSEPRQTLFEQANQMLFMPVGLGQRNLNRRWCDGSAAALVAKFDPKPLDGQVSGG